MVLHKAVYVLLGMVGCSWFPGGLVVNPSRYIGKACCIEAVAKLRPAVACWLRRPVVCLS
jgi:hypothetical protein